jgi:hypothetical protein
MSTDKPITADLTAILEIEKKFKTQKKKLFEDISSNTEESKKRSMAKINELKKQLSIITSVVHNSETETLPANTEAKAQVTKDLSQKMQKNSTKAEELLDKYLFS